MDLKDQVKFFFLPRALRIAVGAAVRLGRRYGIFRCRCGLGVRLSKTKGENPRYFLSCSRCKRTTQFTYSCSSQAVIAWRSGWIYTDSIVRRR